MTCELLMVYEAVCHPRFANGIDVYRHADYADRSRLFLVLCARPYAYHKDVIGRLMNEVYANISRHASSGGKYEVSVLVKTHSLEITEVNDMGARHSGSLPGGHGLRQFAAEIEHIGGSLSTDCENGIWMFHARIPFD